MNYRPENSQSRSIEDLKRPWPLVPFSPFLSLLCISQPFFWARLPIINLSAPTFASFVFIGLGFFYPKRMLDSLIAFYREAFWFHTTFIAYLISLCVSTLASGQLKTSAPVLVATILGTFCYFGIGARLFGLRINAIKNSVLYGMVIGMIGFLVYSQYVFSALGQSLIEGVQQALNSGTSQIGARLMREIVNYSGGEKASDGDSEISGAVRNTLASCLAFFFFFAIACLSSERKQRLRPALASLAILACPLLTLLLASRSNLISIALGLAVLSSVFVYFASNSVMLKNILILILLAFAVFGLTVAFSAEWMSDNAVVAANMDRLSKVQDDPRIENYRLALNDSIRSPYLGKGPGAHVADGHTVHNLILGAWFEAGVFGLFAAVAMYASLIWLWQRRVLTAFSRNVSISFSQILVQASAAAMLTGPVIRRMISGNGGRFAFVELFTLAIFIVLTAKSRFTEREAATGLHDGTMLESS